MAPAMSWLGRSSRIRTSAWFGLGALLAWGAVLVAFNALVEWLPTVPSVYGRLSLIAAISGALFFGGGAIAGTSLQPADRGRVGVGVSFLIAGMLLPFWLLSVWVGQNAAWPVLAFQWVACTVIWTAAGVAGGLILRDEVASLWRAVTGFAIGGVAAGACYVGGLLLDRVAERRFSFWIVAATLTLVAVLPPLVAGAIIGRTAATMSTADPDPA
jgi:hypothetical protein